MDWRDIGTAPKDGDPFVALVHRKPFLIQWVDTGDFETWGATEEDDYLWPSGWDEGLCWDENSDCEPSARPTHWMPLPPPPAP